MGNRDEKIAQRYSINRKLSKPIIRELQMLLHEHNELFRMF